MFSPVNHYFSSDPRVRDVRRDVRTDPALKEVVTLSAAGDQGKYRVDRGQLTGEAGRPRRDTGRILLVDDTADTREMFALYFRSRGFTVETACDGLAAIDAAQRLRPDVIVMDVAMPRLDGIGATRKLQHDPRTADIPIVILTAYPIRAIKGGALATGARFVMKPCAPEELEQHIRSMLDDTRRSSDAVGDR